MVEIPRFTPGVGANFRAIQGARGTGFRTAAQAVAQTGNAIQGLANEIASDLQNLKNASDQRYINNLETDLITKQAELEDKFSDNPVQFAEAFGAYVEGTAEKAPLSIRQDYTTLANRRGANAYVKVQRNFSAQQQKLAARDAAANLELLERDIISNGLPANDLEGQVVQDSMLAFENALQGQIATGNMTANEAALRRLELAEKQQAVAALDVIQQQENPLEFTLDIVEGNTGDKTLDNLSANAKQKVLSQAQQLFNAQVQQDQFEDKQREQFIEARRVQAASTIYTDPTSEEAGAALNTMRTLATSLSDVEQAQKFEDFIETSQDARWAESDPDIIADLQNKQARGELSDAKLEELHGNGLSTDDFSRFREDIQRQRDSLISSQTYRLVKDRLDSEFPSPKKVNPMEVLLGLTPDVTEETLKRQKLNDKLKNEALLKLREQILVEKTINTENDLLEQSQKEIMRLRQESQQSKVEDKVQTMPERVARSQQEVNAAVDRYRQNIEQFKLDAKAGKINRDLQRKVWAVLKNEQE